MSLLCVNDFEENAKQKLSKINFEFYLSGAGQQRTLEWNKTSYAKYRIRPKYMRRVSNRSTSTTILGKNVAVPIGISPTAFHKLAHPEGESGCARAAESFGSIFILSTHSNTSLEDVARAAPNGRKWLQTYILTNRKITEEVIKSAEAAGFEAIVLTVDFAVFGIRLVNIRNNFMVPPNLSASEILEKYRKDKLLENFVEFSDPNADWDYIKWLKTITDLPIVVKGVLTAEDATLAVKAGADAILVSNHGARQLDSLPATIEALPEVVKAVGSKVDVYVDGGIRDGTDVFKALAMGAKMVFIGRPAIWGLAHDGEAGVKEVIGILKNELDNAMAITGCATIKEITQDMVVHESYYSRL